MFKIFYLFFIFLILPQTFANDDHCNQEIFLKDWSFKNFSNSLPSLNETDNIYTLENDYWSLKYPKSVDVSFVTSLSENFDNQEIIGYKAIKISMNNHQDYQQNTFTLSSLNNNIPVNGKSTRFYISFRVSSVYDNFFIQLQQGSILLGGWTGTNSQFSRVFKSKSFSSGYLPMNKLDLMFKPTPKFGFNVLYIEDLKVYKVSDSTIQDQDLYVSNQGSDIQGDGTIDNPFSSIQQAIGQAFVKNVYVLPGIYCGMGNSWINPAGKSISLIGYQMASTSNNTILDGENQLMLIDYTSWDDKETFEIKNIIFQNSHTQCNGGYIRGTGSTNIKIRNCKFLKSPINSKVQVLLNYPDNVLIENSIFRQDKDYSLIVKGTNDYQSIDIVNSTFSLLSLSIVNYRVSIENSQFGFKKIPNIIGNFHDNCGFHLMMVPTLFLFNSTISTTMCFSKVQVADLRFIKFTSQRLFKSSSLILSQNSNIYLRDSIFEPLSIQNCLIMFRGEITILNTTFNTTCDKLLNVQQSNLRISDSFFDSTKMALLLDSSTCVMDSIFFLSVESILTTSLSYVVMLNTTIKDQIYTSTFISSSVQTIDLIIEDNNNILLFTFRNSTYNDYNSRFSNNNGIALYAFDSSINLLGTLIENNRGGSFMQLFGTSNLEADKIVAKFNVMYEDGGIISMYNSGQMIISNSDFYSNFAVENKGSVIFTEGNIRTTLINCTGNYNRARIGGFYASVSQKTHLTIQDGNYDHNEAIEGDFIYYYGEKPIIIGDVVKNPNSSITLGILNLKVISNILNVSNIINSGDEYSFYVQLVDIDGAPVTNKFCLNQENCQMFFFLNGVLLDVVPISNSSADAYFPKLKLIGTIGQYSKISIHSNDKSIQPKTWSIKIDDCFASYKPNAENNLCVPCPYNTYGLDGLQCKPCSDNLICLGGQNFYPQDGYWVDPLYSYFTGNVTPYQCPPDVCLGYECLEHYQGPLCAQCEDGYFNCGSGCKKVDSYNVFVILLKVFTFFGLVLIQQISSNSSGLVPIVLYFLQTLVVISTSGIKFTIWNNLSGAATTSSTSLSSSAISIFNDCIGPFDYYWNHYFILFQPIFLLTTLTFIIGLEFVFRITGIIFKVPLLKNFMEKSHKEFRNRQFSAFIKVCMNSYGPFITEILLIFFCSQVGSYDLLIANPSVQCVGQEYSVAKKISEALLVIVILFPIIIFILIFWHRNRLDDIHIQRKLGVFFLKYKTNFYYWDVVLLIKRILIVTLSLLDNTSAYRSVSLVLLSLVSLFIQIKFQPFLSTNDNYLETISLILLFISCIYLDNSLYQETEEYIILICVGIFVLATIKLQGQYYWNIVRKVVNQFIVKIKKWRESKRKHEILENYFINYDQDYYTQDDSDDDDNSDTYGSKRILLKLDKENSSINNQIYNFIDDELDK
ncbi:hypothetical protein CYY_009795 [Polysphondylium violaceum]|uniref:Transmembrane protein n=1 Tax=Polysphondylium violaceum TaxID=133409 RepID=A0A8J4PL67_9MYCE|nr:hypothetical protein CYY_009795 [Polysphondylium violaceum]